MSCTHPRIMAVADLSKKEILPSGEVKKTLDFQLLELFRRKDWKCNIETRRAYRLVSKDSRDHELESIPSWSLLKDMEIPCGNCIQCRLDYSKTWAVRCYLESLQYQHNYFVTLTYDDDHVRLGLTENQTCIFKDFQDFMKRLRKYFKYHYNHVGIRYFGAQEYGDQSMRPHGHIILFNCPIPDLSYDFHNEDGTITHHNSSCGPMMWSKIISDIWGLGFVTIEDANYNTEAYVSRYIMKKQKGTACKDVYEKQLLIEPPRIFMSLKPTIGGQYFYDNEEYLLSDPKLIVPRGDKSPMIAGVPRYYKRKLLDRHPELYDDMMAKAKDNTLKSRSLLKGKIKINDNRRNEEEHTIKSFEAFGRSAI